MILIRMGVLVLILLFLAGGLGFGQNTAKQILTKGVEHAAQGNFTEAKEEFEKVLKADPFFETVKNYLRLVEYVNLQEIKAETAIIFFKGAAFNLKGKWDDAIDEYTKAIEINPNFTMALNYRGIAYLNKGQHDKAISDCNTAIKLNPRLAMAYNNRGVSYFFKREYAKAWDDVHEAEGLGWQVHPGFLKALREASGRQK